VLRQRDIDKSFPPLGVSPPRGALASRSGSFDKERAPAPPGAPPQPSLSLSPARMPRLDYTREFPSRDIPAHVTANAKLLRELRLDQ
jgi:hypothetical protein